MKCILHKSPLLQHHRECHLGGGVCREVEGAAVHTNDLAGEGETYVKYISSIKLRIDTPSAIAFSVLSFEQTLLDVDFCA